MSKNYEINIFILVKNKLHGSKLFPHFPYKLKPQGQILFVKNHKLSYHYFTSRYYFRNVFCWLTFDSYERHAFAVLDV